MAATQALAAGCHYFDLTEGRGRPPAPSWTWPRAPRPPSCRSAAWRRGFIGIVAHHLTKKFDKLNEVKMRVGALPAFPTNTLKYNLTWSVDGLINEYCHPCEAIHDGEKIELLPLEGLEHFSLDGTEYEAFNTSGGLGTLCETLAGKVDVLDYKTVRYPRPLRHHENAAAGTAAEVGPGDAEGHPAPLHPHDHAGRGAGVRHRQWRARRQADARGVCPQDFRRPQRDQTP